MLGRLHVRFMYIIVWPVKVFTSQRMSMMIVFTVHNAKVLRKVTPNLFDALSLWWEWLNRFTHFPIIFARRVEIVILCFAVRRRFKNVFQLIGILFLSARLVKILIEVGVRFSVIFTWHHVEVVDPLVLHWPTISCFRAKRRMKNAPWTALKTSWRKILGIVFLSIKKWLRCFKGNYLQELWEIYVLFWDFPGDILCSILITHLLKSFDDAVCRHLSILKLIILIKSNLCMLH